MSLKPINLNFQTAPICTNCRKCGGIFGESGRAEGFVCLFISFLVFFMEVCVADPGVEYIVGFDSEGGGVCATVGLN